MAKRWIFLTTVLFFLCGVNTASGLKVIEKDPFYIYFPDNSEQLAARIASYCAPMATFLQEKGLAVDKPLHIILDAELDRPKEITVLIPHRQIRLPLRPPGVLEDGYSEADPWRYYLFKGLCAHGIYSERSGLPGGAYRIFGEVMSPNLILPDWVIDGIGHLLYEQFSLRRVSDPMADAIFQASAIPEMDKVSNHPEIWPGRFSYRIFGRPFLRWLEERQGWDQILNFLQLHGRGIIPIEIDIKASRAFGQSWNLLWRYFQAEHISAPHGIKGLPMLGYWESPFIYWNEIGIHPGIQATAARSRYGYVDGQGWLWLSEFTRDGTSKIKIYRHGILQTAVRDHVWDPGQGSVAVTRNGQDTKLIVFGQRSVSGFFDDIIEEIPIQHEIPAPPGTLQMSGPVMDENGRIAVSAGTAGNWDIWLFDEDWQRLTHGPSVEMDPWWIDNSLVFVSNATGRFQIHDAQMRPMTQAPTAVTMPRSKSYLQLDAKGWQRYPIATEAIPPLPMIGAQPIQLPAQDRSTTEEAQQYSAWKSISPNHLLPDIFFDTDDFQFGLATQGLDVSEAYAWDAGFRYSTNSEDFTWRLGYKAKELSARVTRYPFSYTTLRLTNVDEKRIEVKASWSPEKLKAFSLSANWRDYVPNENDDLERQEWWANVGWIDTMGRIRTSANLDIFTEGSQSLYGEVRYWFGETINTILRLQGGKTWGELNPGHNTFRIGGISGEGFFTQRATRLFPLRGFDSNILDAGQAASASVDVRWPLAKLQTGYKTLPLFLHNINIGTFVDAGFASDRPDYDEVLISAGIEFNTGMELAWGIMSNFNIGLAWPLKQPEGLDEEGPVLLIQIGRPL